MRNEKWNSKQVQSPFIHGLIVYALSESITPVSHSFMIASTIKDLSSRPKFNQFTPVPLLLQILLHDDLSRKLSDFSFRHCFL